jgi:hypothetical protein
MYAKKIQMSAYVFCAAILAACGGGGGAIVSTPASFQNASGTEAVTVLRTDGSSREVLVLTETFGSLTIATGQTYSGLLSDGSVAGLEAPSADTPTAGEFTYAGYSSAVINDGSHFYELNGRSSATLTLTASSSDLDVTLSEFSGKKTDAVTSVVTVVSVSDIEITWQNAVLAGSRLGGGTVDVINTAATLSGSESVNVSGVLFGPSSEELGGLISVVDGTNLDVTAGFIAKQ